MECHTARRWPTRQRNRDHARQGDQWARRASVALPSRAAVLTLALASTAFMVLAPGSGSAVAEAAAAPEADAGPRVQLDVPGLIGTGDLLSRRVDGPVWQIEARDGWRLLRLPMLVETPEAETELTRSPINLRGGYFIAWQLQRPEEPEPRDRGRGHPGSRPAPRSSGPDRWPERAERVGGPEGWSMPAALRRAAAGSRAPSASASARQRTAREDRAGVVEAIEAADLAEPMAFVFPEGAPTFARRLTLLPSGRVRWGIERTIRDAELRSGTGRWLVKVRPDRLRDRMPEPPDDRRDRDAMRRYREQTQAALAFRQEVRELPDTFEIPMPRRLWAVYAVMDQRDDLAFTGEAELLPWTIRMQDLEMLRSFAGRSSRGRGARGGRDGDGSLDGDRLDAVRRMSNMTADGHPLTLRAIAHALHRAGVAGQMETHDPLYQLVQHIINGPDEPARQRVLRDLAMVDRPTPATVSLLRDAAGRMDGETRLIALRGMLRAEPTDVQQQREMFRIANQLLADPTGPSPDKVLAELTDHVHQGSPLMVGATHGLDFASLPDARRDRAIAFVIRHAGTHTVAENWLTHRLLGTPDPRLVQRTLELLNRVDTGPTPMTPVVDAMFDLVFERRDAVAERDGAEGALDLRVDGLAPLNSDNHSLFRAINSGDPFVYELAWGALPAFQIPERDSDSAAAAMAVANRYELVVDAALSRGAVPTEVVTFLERQPNATLAARGLLRVALAGDEAAAVEVVRALHGSRLPVGVALERLTRGERAAFARLVYGTLSDEVPLTVGLMRDPGEEPEVVGWFGRAVARGQLPEAGDWADAYDDERALLVLAVVDEAPESEEGTEGAANGGDVELAQAAVAALVSSVGGTRQMAQELAHRFTAERGRSVNELEEDWRAAKRDIHSRRLAQAAGDYRLIVQPPMAPGGFGRPAPIVLGVVELVAGAEGAYLGRNQTVLLDIPDDRFAIRIAQPNDLKNFPSTEIADLPLRDIDGGLDLLPRADGSWRGEAQMGDHGPVEVRLEPVG